MIDLNQLRERVDNARAQVKVKRHLYEEAKSKLEAVEATLKDMGFDVSDMSTLEAQLRDLEQDAQVNMLAVENGMEELAAAIG